MSELPKKCVQGLIFLDSVGNTTASWKGFAIGLLLALTSLALFDGLCNFTGIDGIQHFQSSCFTC